VGHLLPTQYVFDFKAYIHLLLLLEVAFFIRETDSELDAVKKMVSHICTSPPVLVW
jgi:hypothetical protein